MGYLTLWVCQRHRIWREGGALLRWDEQQNHPNNYRAEQSRTRQLSISKEIVSGMKRRLRTRFGRVHFPAKISQTQMDTAKIGDWNLNLAKIFLPVPIPAEAPPLPQLSRICAINDHAFAVWKTVASTFRF